MSSQPDSWMVGFRRTVSLDTPLVMGILNATPDSFHDGRSDFLDLEAMTKTACAMIDEGASIIDIGGESTRPGSQRIDPREQCRRTIPLIRQLARERDCLISIDTTHSAVASDALDAGAQIVNDVSAGLEDPALFPLVAKRGCGLVLMHRLVEPGADVYSHQYEAAPEYGSEGVVGTVVRFLQERVDSARSLGVAAEQLMLDPGLGFGKSVQQNLDLIRELPQLVANLGCPVLLGASRKSFIGSILGDRPPDGRLFGSLAVAVLAGASGASVIRCHDVESTVDALKIVEATIRRVPGSGGIIP